MNKVQKRVVTGIASLALFFNAAMPALATTVEITGNDGVENTVLLNQNNTTGVVQTNNADIDNHVSVTASTGGNEAEHTTGGNVTIKTGDAETTTTVTNQANVNVATVEDCATCGTGADVLISGNGDGSKNLVDLDINQKSGENAAGTFVTQTNTADIYNDVDGSAKTGRNEAEHVTGGNVTIDTGDATSNVTVSTTANANVASVSGAGEGEEGEGGVLSARIVGNGSDSTNTIDLDVNRSILVDQDNNADVDNYVDATAKTGKNEAEHITGGTVEINTGDADVTLEVDNMVNFNSANVDCGCVVGEDLLKLSGNGDGTKNKILADLKDSSWVTQDNHLDDLDNWVDAAGKTGHNKVEESTGSVTGDPMIDTGDAMIDASVINAVNSNIKGTEEEGANFELPDMSQFNFNFSFDLSDLLSWLASQNA